MNARQVVLGAVVFAIVASLMALPWLICLRGPFAAIQPERVEAQSGVFRYDGKTFEQWQTTWAKELKTDQRLEALRAMTAFGTHGFGKEATEVVIEIVREHCKELGSEQGVDDQDPIFKEARTALIRIGPASSLPLLECLKDSARNLGPLARIFMEVELHPSAVPILVKLVQGDNPDWSTLALQTLGNTLQKKTVPIEIESTLLDSVKKGKYAKKFIDVLQRAMTVDRTRRPAVLIARTLGPTAQPLSETLLEVVQKRLVGSPSSAPVQDMCVTIEALGRVQGDPNRALPVLAGFVGNRTERREVRSSAVKAVAEFGPVVPPGILLEVLDDVIGCEALEALVKIQASPVHVVPRLLQALNREVDGPARPGNDAAPSLTPIAVVSARPNLKFIRCSLDYFGQIGPQAPDAVPVLVQVFNKVSEVRPQVVAVLEKIGPSARFEAQRLSAELRGSFPGAQDSGVVKQVSFDWSPSQGSGGRGQESGARNQESGVIRVGGQESAQPIRVVLPHAKPLTTNVPRQPVPKPAEPVVSRPELPAGQSNATMPTQPASLPTVPAFSPPYLTSTPPSYAPLAPPPPGSFSPSSRTEPLRPGEPGFPGPVDVSPPQFSPPPPL